MTLSLKNIFIVIVVYICCYNNRGKAETCFQQPTNTENNKQCRLNSRPIIGILSQKVTSKYTPFVNSSSTYIASSYVKHLESAGAQVVPILSTHSEKKILKVMRNLNGVLFPGGSAPLIDSTYIRAAKTIFREAKSLNRKGIHYPLWGTCLGYETLSIIGSGQKPMDILIKVDAENLQAPINFTMEAFRSRLFRDFDMELMRALMFQNLSMHMHQMGVDPEAYQKYPKISNMFKILGLNKGRNGKEFVSVVEGVKYPFYGTQYHPEKNIFEWTRKEQINHSPDAVRAAQLFANFFVNEARKNELRFDTIEETEKALIFHNEPVYSGGLSTFEQVYIFNKDGPDRKHRVYDG